MRKRLINLLKCPNGGVEPMQMFAFKAERGHENLVNYDCESLHDEDNVVSGILICRSSSSVYTIEQSIPVLLSDDDIDRSYLEEKLASFMGSVPRKYEEVLSKHLERIKIHQVTNESKWNSEEMVFYDRAVENEEKRQAMLKDIRERPIWRNFIPREKYITRRIKPFCQGQSILEIGSGNSRTIANVFSPYENSYHYIGSDISFKRLLVAKMAIPEGDFIQASAMNLPFVDTAFLAIISFGMLHHLPRPMAAITDCAPKIKSGGFFCFHEPIVKPKILGGRKTFFSRMLTTYEHSEHDSDLNLSGALAELENNGFIVEQRNNFNSFFKTFSEFILKKITPRRFHMGKFVVKSLFFIDRFFLNTFCRIWRGFGPHGVIIVAKKSVLQSKKHLKRSSTPHDAIFERES